MPSARIISRTEALLMTKRHQYGRLNGNNQPLKRIGYSGVPLSSLRLESCSPCLMAGFLCYFGENRTRTLLFFARQPVKYLGRIHKSVCTLCIAVASWHLTQNVNVPSVIRVNPTFFMLARVRWEQFFCSLAPTRNHHDSDERSSPVS